MMNKDLIAVPGIIPNVLIYIKRENIPDIEKFADYLLELSEKEEYFNKKTVEVTRNIPSQLRYEILSDQKWRCNNCAIRLKYRKDSPFGDEVAHIDHIHPFSKRDKYINGEENINERSNLQALCPKCNSNKGKKTK